MPKKKALRSSETAAAEPPQIEESPANCCDREFRCEILPKGDQFACNEHNPKCECSKTLPHNGYENHNYLKCAKNQWCHALDQNLAPEANAHVKGFSTCVLTNMMTGKARCYGISYKSNGSKGGLLIRYCPWCGVNLYELYEVEKSPEERSE